MFVSIGALNMSSRNVYGSRHIFVICVVVVFLVVVVVVVLDVVLLAAVVVTVVEFRSRGCKGSVRTPGYAHPFLPTKCQQ